MGQEKQGGKPKVTKASKKLAARKAPQATSKKK